MHILEARDREREAEPELQIAYSDEKLIAQLLNGEYISKNDKTRLRRNGLIENTGSRTKPIWKRKGGHHGENERESFI
jgi:hypothetical protein